MTTTVGSSVTGLFFPNPKADLIILYSHGNAEDLLSIQDRLIRLVDLGMAVFAYDYDGYGTSSGDPSEEGSYADIEAAYHHVTANLGFKPEQVILYGRSLGGGPSVDLAARQRVGGLVLEGAFASAFRVVTRVSLLPFDKFENVDKIASSRCPVLVMHGQKDEIIGFWHGQTLYDRAPEPKRSLWIAQAHHNDIPTVAGQTYNAALLDFAVLVRERARIQP